MKVPTRFLTGGLLAVFIFVLVACGGQAPPATAVPEETPVVELAATDASTLSAASPTAGTDASPQAPPTATPSPSPSPTSTSTPSAPATATAVPSAYAITIDTPLPEQKIPVARPFTFRGRVEPIPEEPLQLFLAAAGDELGSLLADVMPDPNSGEWELTADIHPRRTGPAVLRVGAGESTISLPVLLVYAEGETGTFVTVNQPQGGAIAAGGRVLLVDGESRNPIDGRLQIAVYGCPTEEKTNRLAQIEIQAGDGPWNAFVILPEQATDGCNEARLIVGTGGLEELDPSIRWMADNLLVLVPPDDERARYIRISDPFHLTFRPGEPAFFSGSAPAAPESTVTIALNREPAGAEAQILATTTARVDRFGYWTANLTLPDGLEPGPAILVVMGGSDENAVSTRVTTAIAP